MSYELEAEEQEQRREIEHRALEDFVAIAAHDLRQPLTVLHGRAQLLARRVRKEGQGTPLVAEIDAVVEQTKRAIQLSDVLLDIARIQAGDLELDKAEFDLVSLARRAVDEARSAAPGHTFDLNVPGELQICADERRLGRVVTNLLANASKYAPAESGPIVLGISKSDLRGGAGSAELTVSDSGPGVPDDDLSRIFERHYRTSDAQATSIGGSGLGLFIARQIVKTHGGTIRAEHTPGGGLSVRITLPLS